MKPYYQDEWVTIYHGDCAEVMADLDDESVDLVFTDPPYPNEFDHVWDLLADGAPRLMRPGSSLLTYCGHYQMPRVLSAFDGKLRYNWLCIQRNNGSQPRIFGRRAICAFKPVLWFTKGPIDQTASPMVDELTYVPTGIVQRKQHHIWGQPVILLPMLRLTKPGGVVLDPFMGSGTTLRAAKDTERRSIGIEIDERHCETAVRRLGQEVLPLGAS